VHSLSRMVKSEFPNSEEDGGKATAMRESRESKNGKKSDSKVTAKEEGGAFDQSSERRSDSNPLFAMAVNATDNPEGAVPAPNLERSAALHDERQTTPGAVHVAGMTSESTTSAAEQEGPSTDSNHSPNLLVNAELVEIDGNNSSNNNNNSHDSAQGEVTDEENQKVLTVQAERMESPLRVLLRSRRVRIILAVIVASLIGMIIWVSCRDTYVLVVDAEGNVIDKGEEDEFECLLDGEDC